MYEHREVILITAKTFFTTVDVSGEWMSFNNNIMKGKQF